MNIKRYIVPVLAVVIGLGLGYWIWGGGEGHAHEEEVAGAEIYTCSMHPQIRQEGPGQCPICGMDLIPVGDNAGTDLGPGAVSMTETAKALANIQTVAVRYAVPEERLTLSGRIAVNEDARQTITARFPGRIEDLKVSTEGETVRKGQVVAQLYAPTLVAAQQELLEAAKMQDTRPNWLEAVKARLMQVGLTESQIASVLEEEKPREYWPLFAQAAGTVVKVVAKEGGYVKEGEALLEVASLGQVWLELEAFGTDLGWIDRGDEVQFTVEGQGTKAYTAKIDYVDPVLNAATRTATVRATVRNANGTLRPDLLVTAQLEAKPKDDAVLLVPKTAVLWTGKRSVVWVADPQAETPVFSFREVQLGEPAGAYYAVLAGLEEGERVVSEGAFAVDASAQLAGKRSMMQPDVGLTDVGDHAYEATPAFREYVQLLVAQYLTYKDALVQENEGLAASTLTKFSALLAREERLTGGAARAWKERRTTMQEAIGAAENSVDGYRNLLATLSESLYATVKSFGLADTGLYYQYCPMAFDDQGAFWLSITKEIRNPYFGDAMLSCGETRETLN